MSRFGGAVASLLLFWTGLVYVPFRWRPIGRYVFVAKLYAAASTPFIAAAGVLLAAVGALRKSWPMVVPAGLAAGAAATVVARLGRLRPNLAAALGPGWEARMPRLKIRRWPQASLGVCAHEHGVLVSEDETACRESPFRAPTDTTAAGSWRCSRWRI